MTSMNLYDFSQVNNNEMGLLVSRDAEPRLYDEIFQESMRIVRISEEIRVKVARVASTEKSKQTSGAKRKAKGTPPNLEAPKSGFCIRCKAPIAANPTRPYCNRCFASWKRYENMNYAENHCHVCGTNHSASLSKPLCLGCYKKYQGAFKFS